MSTHFCLGHFHRGSKPSSALNSGKSSSFQPLDTPFNEIVLYHNLPLGSGPKNPVHSLYVDGKKETERNIGATMDSPAALKFGGWGSENLVGGLDEVFVTKMGVALEEEDIQLLVEEGWETALAVSAKGKLATTWAILKAQ